MDFVNSSTSFIYISVCNSVDESDALVPKACVVLLGTIAMEYAIESLREAPSRFK